MDRNRQAGRNKKRKGGRDDYKASEKLEKPEKYLANRLKERKEKELI